MTVMKLRRRVPSKLRRRYGHFPTLARLKNSAKIMAYVRDPTHGPHVHVAYEGNEGNPTRLRIADDHRQTERPQGGELPPEPPWDGPVAGPSEGSLLGLAPIVALMCLWILLVFGGCLGAR